MCHSVMLITPIIVWITIPILYDTKMTWGFGNVGDNNYLCIMVQSYTNHGRGGFSGHGRVDSDLPYIFFIRVRDYTFGMFCFPHSEMTSNAMVDKVCLVIL